MVQLGVNIDHVATVRQARRTYEPDPVAAAAEAILGGADGITVHLREDRRHIQDADVMRLRQECPVKLNLEMAAVPEMVEIACRIKPSLAMLVPEGRHEVTTEGGLDVAAQEAHVTSVIRRLTDAGIVTSIFIDADPRQIEAAARAGASVCEVHTGPYAHAFYEHGGQLTAPSAIARVLREPSVAAEHQRVFAAGKAIVQTGMQFNAGHALNYFNVQPIAALPSVRELHIGHAIVSRAVFTGLRAAVAEMKRLIAEADRAAQAST